MGRKQTSWGSGIRRALFAIAVASVACSDGASEVEAQVFAFEKRGRLSVSATDLDRDTPVVIHLDYDDEGTRPTRTARVVSEDGRRLDTRVERVPGREATFRLDLDGAFLRPGRYLIEIDGQGRHPLNLRRYVIQVTES
ncbi:MAG: hypothetical protein ACPGVZ_09795 [Myxococcota bacterium]